MFLEFRCWNLVPFLPDRFPAAEEFVVIFDIFFCLMMRQMFSIGERSGLQAGQFSTRTHLLQRHAVVIAAVCGLFRPAEIHKAFPEIDVTWRGAYVALKPLYTFQHS